VEGLPQRKSWVRRRYREHDRRVGKQWQCANPPHISKPALPLWLAWGFIGVIALYAAAMLGVVWYLARRL
jgi:hypothetical protein